MRYSRSFLLAGLLGAASLASATSYQLVVLDNTNLVEAIPYGYANGQVVAVSLNSSFQNMAAYWNGPSASVADLTPSISINGAQAWGCSSTDEVGGYYPSFFEHAVLWQGSAGSFVDLNPDQWPNVMGSLAQGTNGSQEVGYTTFSTFLNHATVWSGTAASAVDIHPTATDPNGSSVAMRIGDNGSIVGTLFDNGAEDACYWPNSSSQAIDLNPAGWPLSQAFGVDGGQQVGFGLSPADFSYHALLWSGSAASFVDLGQGQAFDGRNGVQVGVDANNMAATWNGSAATVQELPIPGGYFGSAATAIGDDGVIAGYLYNFSQDVPVLWVPSAPSDTPPTLSGVSVSQNSLWPPNKKMIPVTVNYTATDQLNSPSQLTYALSLSCNENVAASAMVVVDAHHVLLQADRLGGGSGRVYTITITVTNTSGQSSTGTATVTVPHDQGK